ncbi:MAG: glycosyltransferase [Balneolaceae bacterium]|nr:glycosyltransferase [Balneolaceae bacterium]
MLCTSIYGKDLFRDEESLAKLDCSIYHSNHAYSKFQRFTNLLSGQPSTWNSIGKIIEEEAVRLDIPKPDVILCFRMLNAPIALHLQERWNIEKIWLDIDEIDSRVRFDIANRMASEGYYFRAVKERVEGFFYAIQENSLIPEFDRIYASTIEEKNSIDRMGFGVQTEVKPNMLPVSNRVTYQKTDDNPYTFMFVGDSNYFPNLDAIDRILFEIVPGLEKIAQVPFRFVIIGGDLGEAQQQQIRKYDSVVYHQDVDDLKAIYDRSNAVVVPLRVGGGSSLKFLEALSRLKPVVATPVGARGFGVRNGEHALIGESSGELIHHCNHLISDMDLNRKLSEKGYQWFLDHYSYEINVKATKETVNNSQPG